MRHWNGLSLASCHLYSQRLTYEISRLKMQKKDVTGWVKYRIEEVVCLTSQLKAYAIEQLQES